VIDGSGRQLGVPGAGGGLDQLGQRNAETKCSGMS
jgi:hypothetical protein